MSASDPMRKPGVAETDAALPSIAVRLEHLVDEAPPSVPCDVTTPDEYAGDTATAHEPGDRDDAAA